MAATSISTTKGSLSCLLPLWEALQNQQVYLTQDLFKSLPLCLVSDHVRFCMHPLRAMSLFPTSLQLSHMQAPMPDILGAKHFYAGFLGWGVWCVAWTLHSLGRTSAIIMLSFVGCLLRAMCLDYTISPPLPPLLLWFLIYIFSWGKYFLLGFKSFSLIVDV